jgi:hypothetical protein
VPSSVRGPKVGRATDDHFELKILELNSTSDGNVGRVDRFVNWIRNGDGRCRQLGPDRVESPIVNPSRDG